MPVTVSKLFSSNYTIDSVDDHVAAFPMIYGDESIALAVRVKIDDVPWTSVFRLRGNGANLGVFTCPDCNELCVLCGERASIINVTRMRSHGEVFFEHITQVVPIKMHSLLLMASYTGLLAYGKARILWKAPDLCSDELQILAVDDNQAQARCSGFFAARDARGEFSIDLKSGDLKEFS